MVLYGLVQCVVAGGGIGDVVGVCVVCSEAVVSYEVPSEVASRRMVNTIGAAPKMTYKYVAGVQGSVQVSGTKWCCGFWCVVEGNGSICGCAGGPRKCGGQLRTNSAVPGV
jgi:hypothetical protein